MSSAFDDSKVVARAWSNHGPSSLCTEIDGVVVQLAECSGFGRDAQSNEDVARRMTACWNACLGVPTDMLEQIDGLAKATVPYHQIVAQRDALLAKLAEVNAWIVCAAIATPEDMMQNAARIEEITRAAA